MRDSNSEDGFINVSFVIISAIVGACILLLMYIIRMLNNNNNQTNVTNKKNLNKSSSVSQQDQQHSTKVTGAGGKKQKGGGAAEPKWGGRSNNKHKYMHPWLLTSLKGHTGQVLDMDFSSNGKYLASCAEDRSVLLWSLKNLEEKNRKCLRVNIDYDHGQFVRWSPDFKAFIISRKHDHCIEVYKVERKKETPPNNFSGIVTKALTFQAAHSEYTEVIGLGIACTGKFIMSCSSKTDLVLWDLKGTILNVIDTYLMETWCAKISPCGRFVVASGFAPDVKVWEVVFNKSGEFQHAKRAFELTGHTSGVYDIAFDQDSSHMATVSKDGTWKLFQTNVEYQRGEDPHLKITGKYNLSDNNSKPHIRIALSPNADVIAISVDNSLSFYSTRDGSLDRTLDDLYVTGPIETIIFDSSGQHLFTSGVRHIRVFHNVTGYKTAIQSAKEKLKTSNLTAATKERLTKLVADNEQFLKEIGEKVK